MPFYSLFKELVWILINLPCFLPAQETEALFAKLNLCAEIPHFFEKLQSMDLTSVNKSVSERLTFCNTDLILDVINLSNNYLMVAPQKLFTLCFEQRFLHMVCHWTE